MNETKMTLLEKALGCQSCIVSVMGDHAGEGTDAIFLRKQDDIKRIGVTFWLMRSPKARPEQVKSIFSNMSGYTIFVEPATKGGARPTTVEDKAKEYSSKGDSWFKFPQGLSPVTGKLDTSATALVFDTLTTDVTGTLDLWNYAEASDIRKPLKFILGCSTVCATRKEMKLHPEKMKSRYRRVIAVGRLVEPYCVWLR
jgi:hypothetical protein